jgi:hypothetical protein
MYSDEDKYAEEYDNEKYDSENEEHNDDGRAELIVSNIYKCKNDLPRLRKVYKLALSMVSILPANF